MKTVRHCRGNLDKIWEWSGTWQMEFNLGKCKKIKFGRSGRRCEYDHKMGSKIICRGVEEKDLGVTISENMSLDKHINRITGQTINLLRNIRTAFVYLD